ncbi:MAG: STT3 domain-containing protein [Candidatus Woesearchaeota archaeon]
MGGNSRKRKVRVQPEAVSAPSSDFKLDFGFLKRSNKPKKNSTASPKYTRFAWILLLLIPILVAVYFRAYPYWLPQADNFAASTVSSNIQANIRADIQSKAPALPPDRLAEETKKQYQDTYAQNKAQIDSIIEQNAQNIRSRFQLNYPDGSAQTYLLAIDPYFHLVRVRNYLDHGYVGEKTVNGKSWNALSMAPVGMSASNELHIMIGVLSYKIMHIFNNNVDLLAALFPIPILISALSIIPAFFIIRRRVGNVGAFIGSVFLAVGSSFIGRTVGGFADTDAYVVFFALLVTWFFLEAMERPSIKAKIIYGALAGIAVGLFSFAWSGWWYIFDFIIISSIGYIGYRIIRQFISERSSKRVFKDVPLRNAALVFGIFLVVGSLAVIVFSGVAPLKSAPLNPLSFMTIKDAVHTSLWPNVYTTVAELNPANLSQIVNSQGGRLIFILGSLGVLGSLFGKKMKWQEWVLLAAALIILVIGTRANISDNLFLILFALPVVLGLLRLLVFRTDDVDVKFAILLIIWFIGTMYASFKGIRFILLLTPVFAVSLGVATGLIHNYVKDLFASTGPVARRVGSIAIAVILCLILISPLRAANNTAVSEMPSMNDAWWDSLTKINEQTPQDTIITSWWDFGHWFRAVAQRGVTFDGGSQNTPPAHWVGEALLTSDENKAVGIVRMLDCSQNQAFEYLYTITGNLTFKPISILEGVLPLHDDLSAREYLANRSITGEEADKLISLIHCTPPSGILITSGDMVGKAPVWAHFGAWNFSKALIYRTAKTMPSDKGVALITERLGIDKEQADQMYFEAKSLRTEEEANAWISPWPTYAMNSMRACTVNGTNVSCKIGMGIGQQGTSTLAIDTVTFNTASPQNVTLNLVQVDTKTNQILTRQIGKPSGIVIVTNDTLERYALEKAAVSLDVVYDVANHRAILVSQELSQSMFTRLFFLDGAGTKHFTKFNDVTDITGSRIIVWSIDWFGEK